jgi:ATP-binding cassette subfamily F protein 3
MHARQHELEQRLAEPGLYHAQNKAELNALLREKADVDRESETMEQDWLEACEQLEAQQGGGETR